MKRAATVDITIVTVTYLDDQFAEEFGTKVFTDEADANSWADTYCGGGDSTERFCAVETHTVTLDLTAGNPDG